MLEKSIREMNIEEKAEKAFKLLREDEAVRGQGIAAEALFRKLKDKDMTVAVIGQFKRGKSALSNNILGNQIMPVGIVPITSAVTKVRYGTLGAEVRFENGICREVEISDLHTYISEQENKNNELMVSEVVIHTPSEFLKGDLTYVDTPGVGSFHKNNTEVAYDNMKESDAVIFLLSVDSPINQIEIDFLKNAKDFAARFFFAVNKIDTVSQEELKVYMDYCQMVLGQIMKDDVKLFPVSAKTGEGVEALKTAVLKTVGQDGRKIMELSTEKKLVEIIERAIDQLNFYWKAMNMEYCELDKRFEKIEELLKEVREDAPNCTGGFHLMLNQYKMKLSEEVKSLFGMEYHYDIDLLKFGIVDMSKDDFIIEVNNLCKNLSETLNRILLYREENAYTVIHRINGINRLTRELRRIRDSLKEDLNI